MLADRRPRTLIRRVCVYTLLFIHYTATMAVVIGFSAFSIRYIGLRCSGLETIKSARLIGVVAV
jgi:hypothetical protein